MFYSPVSFLLLRHKQMFSQCMKHFLIHICIYANTTCHIISGVSETEFLTYKGTFGDKLSGKVDTEAGSVSVMLEGRGSSKLQSFFGKLKKEELDVRKLLYDSSNRC